MYNESATNKFLELTLNKEGNGKNLDKIVNDTMLITTADNEVFKMLKEFLIKYTNRLFNLYSDAELKVKSEKWINWKQSEIEKIEKVYNVIYNDMFNRTSIYTNDDIVNFQIEYIEAIKKQKEILNNIKVRVIAG